MAEQLSKVYEPKAIEEQANKIWSSRPYFHAEPTADNKKTAQRPYTIVIPPPNVTAPLHLGHALNNALQDILIRFRRMQGRNTLWMPGTDHAGIATQTVVEKRILSEEGKRRTDFTRQEFIARLQAWKDEYQARIIEQLKAMGCSCDWQRTRFTMDEVCAKAVRAAFFKLFKDGLIYRGKRLVNWDPATQTVLADDEVEHETVQGYFWYLRYPLVEPVRVAGVPPACSNVKNENEGETPSTQPATQATTPLATQLIDKRRGRYLPHWNKEGATYAVVFRLADSVPGEVSEKWRFQKRDIIERAQQQGRPLTQSEQIELQRLQSEKIESFLDAGHGECLLKKTGIAEIMDNALKHFDGQRYDLVAWAIMPNHVHIIIKPHPSYKLSEIVHSWKSFTSKEINRQLKREGPVWMDEYYDHLIRDENDFRNQVNYVLANPEKSGLQNWPWYGIKEERGQDARDTVITYVTVATTRPETMLGDTAVAMNPADSRAKYLVGKKVRLPIVGRIIPVIADEHVVLPDAQSENEKARFSTGFLKVTPAHDQDDWEIGQRQGLAVINVMAPDGTISDKYGWTDWEDVKNPDVENLIGLDRFEAREAIVEWFREEGLLEEVRPYSHEVGHSYRSHVPIEQYLSDQWYIAVKKPIPSLVQSVAGVPPAGNNVKNENEDETPSTHAGKMPAILIEGTDVPVNSLAGLALKPLLDGRLRFIPDRYAKTYQSWLENLRDWPISRQLWWGHRIPVWTFMPRSPRLNSGYPAASHDQKGFLSELQRRLDAYSINMGLNHNAFCALGSPDRVKCHISSQDDDSDKYFDKIIKLIGFRASPGFTGSQPVKASPLINFPSHTANQSAWAIAEMIDIVERDPDVLDTWFSSALWPFSTLGWPDETPQLKTFYPGNVLCTAREIITLWVSRMVMMGQYCAGDIPFSDVFIHAMIQDGEGRKMSKSLGNGIDPLVAINSHGADAMRFTLASMTTQTQDVRMPVEKMKLPDGRVENTSPKFDIGRNFCNKLWNASRFALMNLEGIDPDKFDKDKMTVTDRWILSRLAQTAADVTQQLDEFKYNEPLTQLYKFFWNDFCDWYLEWLKPRMQDELQKPTAQNVLAFTLDQILRLLHPFVPFITEGIFQKLNEITPVRQLKGLIKAQKSEALVIAHWPERLDFLADTDAEKQISIIQIPVRAVRDIKNKYNINSTVAAASADAPVKVANILKDNSELICRTAGIKVFTAGTNIAKPRNAAAAIIDDIQIYVHDVIDPQAERKKLNKQKEEVEKAKKTVEAKLGNENFLAKAKPQVVAQTKDKLAELTEQLKTIEKHLSEL